LRFDRLLLGLRRLDRRPDDRDFLLTEITAVAGMGIEPGDRDARPLIAGRAHALDGEIDALLDPFPGHAGGDLAERDVRGDPRIPEFVQTVEFAAVDGGADGPATEADFIDIVAGCKAHGMLVEGRERHRIDDFGGGEAKGYPEIGESEIAAGGRRLTDLDARGIEMAEVGKGAAIFRKAVKLPEAGAQAGLPFAEVKHPAITDHQDVRGCRDLRIRQQARCQLAADARGIAHGERDRRP
jgi:hypothetical protein